MHADAARTFEGGLAVLVLAAPVIASVEAVEKAPSRFLGEIQKQITSQNAAQSTISCWGETIQTRL
jgi:hypothetical protein